MSNKFSKLQKKERMEAIKYYFENFNDETKLNLQEKINKELSKYIQIEIERKIYDYVLNRKKERDNSPKL